MAHSGDGALVASNAEAVTQGGPADKAGLKAGDLITSFDGRVITSPEELIVAIRSHSVGDKVLVTYLRNKVSKSATLTLTASK
jgi:putative serine protease PepD